MNIEEARESRRRSVYMRGLWAGRLDGFVWGWTVGAFSIIGLIKLGVVAGS